MLLFFSALRLNFTPASLWFRIHTPSPPAVDRLCGRVKRVYNNSQCIALLGFPQKRMYGFVLCSVKVKQHYMLETRPRICFKYSFKNIGEKDRIIFLSTNITKKAKTTRNSTNQHIYFFLKKHTHTTFEAHSLICWCDSTLVIYRTRLKSCDDSY